MDGSWNFYLSWMNLYDTQAACTRYSGNNFFYKVIGKSFKSTCEKVHV